MDKEDRATAPIQGTGFNYKTGARIINESGFTPPKALRIYVEEKTKLRS